jgi:hypothetical protein
LSTSQIINIFWHMAIPSEQSCYQNIRAIFDLQTAPTNYGLPLQPYVKGQFKVDAASATRVAGNKDYELTDHLGNVRHHQRPQDPGGQQWQYHGLPHRSEPMGRLLCFWRQDARAQRQPV